MLRPTRQRNTNLMVMRISGDGERFVIYSPAPGTKLDLAPPPIPGNGADSFHSYATLPAGEGKCLVLFSEECSSYISCQVLSFPAVLSLVVTHAILGHQHCEAVAALLGGTSAALQLPTFPLVLGRKPPAEPAPRPANSGNNSLEKENRAPDNVVAGMADTLLSKVNSEVITLIQ